MKILILSDQYLAKKKFNSLVSNEVFHFSLTSDTKTNHANNELLRNHCKALEIISAPDYINSEIDQLGIKLDKVRLHYSQIKYKNKYLINEFLVDENISSYYFTDLVERNVYKYKDYKCIAQFNAIKQFLVEKNDIDLILYSISDKKLSRVLSTLDLPTKDISSATILPNALRIRGNHLRQFFEGIVTGLLYIFRLLLYHLMQRIFIKKASFLDDSRIKIISYFPFFDAEEGNKGIFKNLYYYPLQKYLENEGMSFSWLLIFAKIKGNNYLDSLKIAREIIKEKFLFIESTLTFSIIIKIFLVWIWHSFKYLIHRRHFFNDEINDQLEMIDRIYAEECLDRSYLGLPVLSGIAYYYLFKAYAQGLNETKVIVYLNEMQTWERAFNAALEKYQPDIRRIGFQHSSVAKRIFHYYSEASAQSDDTLNEPLPDYFAVNGKIAFEELKTSYPNKVITLEALRQLQSSDQNVSSQKKEKTPKQLIYIGSYDKYEADKILDFVSRAFESHGEYRIIVISHPSCDLRDAVKQSRSKYDLNIEIGEKELGNYLEESAYVVVGSSTAAIDAVRYQCRIFVPIFPDHIILSPLSGYDNLFTYISMPEQLLKSIANSRGFNQKEVEQMNRFIQEFWLLDPQLKNWKKVLSDCLN